MNTNIIKQNMFNTVIKINQKQLDKKVKNIKNIIKIYKKINIPYPIKQFYNSIIPLNIFQTWHSKSLPPLMTETKNIIQNMNPAFNYYLFDDNDCREFIKNNFNSNILNAFDSLIPGAYKADLWRYCILYKKGGIYLDIKYTPLNGFKFINLTEKEHFVLDMNKVGIYNALMVCLPNNPILLKAINKIVQNVKNKYYGISHLEPTGPRLLAYFFTIHDKNNLDMKHDIINSNENRFIFFNNYAIFKSYSGYLEEHDKYKKQLHYGVLWKNRQIYI
jgi:mannosyltransferase OCH1-like enzyme